MKRLKLFVSVLIFIVMLTPALCLADTADQLCDAAMGNDIQKVSELVSKGADVNAKSRYGLTPLQCAVWNNHIQLVKLLIEKGADVNEKLDNGETALSIAKSKNRREIEQLLIQAGANENK